MKYDVAIVDGGATGSSAAYFLRNHARAASVCVIEPDPAYEFAELILDGGFQTLDLTRFGYQRVIDCEPYPEHGIL